jgi:hypothetical protein
MGKPTVADSEKIKHAMKKAIPWSKAEGKPKDFMPGKSVGFFIWHEGNTVYLITTSESDKGELFTGRIHIIGKDSKITDVTGIHLEKGNLSEKKGDYFEVEGNKFIKFHFNTAEGVDGIKFKIENGSYLAFFVELEKHKTHHIFIGANETEVDRDPFAFDLSK